MNKKFVKIVSIVLAALMIASAVYILFAVVADTLRATAAPLVSASFVKTAAPLLFAA